MKMGFLPIDTGNITVYFSIGKELLKNYMLQLEHVP